MTSVPATVLTKTCTKCKLEKPFSEFYRNVGCRDKVESHCKACDRSRHKAWRKKRMTIEENVLSNAPPTVVVMGSLVDLEALRKRARELAAELNMVRDFIRSAERAAGLRPQKIRSGGRPRKQNNDSVRSSCDG